jgi:phage/plasmid-associated DNA primase
MVMDYSHGFWRRVRIIPFRKQFEGSAVDDKLLEKLKAVKRQGFSLGPSRAA